MLASSSLCGSARLRSGFLQQSADCMAEKSRAGFLLTFRPNPSLSRLREICDALSKCMYIHELKLACRVLLSFPEFTLWFCFTICRKGRNPASSGSPIYAMYPLKCLRWQRRLSVPSVSFSSVSFPVCYRTLGLLTESDKTQNHHLNLCFRWIMRNILITTFSDIVTLTSFKVIDLTFWLKDVAFLFVPITWNGVALRSLLRLLCAGIPTKVM